MAIEYARVLLAQKKEFTVFGRGVDSAKKFEKAIGVQVITGDLEKSLDKLGKIPGVAIVAVSEEELGGVAFKLIGKKIKRILIEKPAGLDFDQVNRVGKAAVEAGSICYVGYNRRFYASVQKAKEMIQRDGGITSITFDFSEAAFRITPLLKGEGVKENWFLQNSTHVIDLAFFFAGTPKEMYSFVKGNLPWHSKGAIFSGAGITKHEVLFSYHANWDSPGRWAVEVMTKHNKLIFKPLETLQLQKLGTFDIEDVMFDNTLDTQFKPGIYKEIESFLENGKGLCTLQEQVENIVFYEQILEGRH